MCGICGFALSDPSRSADSGRLRRMHAVIAHRGPDGLGERIDGAVALGHRRLSIIDLEGGAQPLANEDGSIWVAFNGEIYNYRELRAQLAARGHRFRTRSDTEVLVHGYEEWGTDLVRRLNGMFAFALHDVRRGRVVLARDHLGIKPLFYAVTGEGLFFGSEIKSVLAGAEMPAALSSDALQEYLVFRYVAGESSFFRGVQRLPAAHVAVWEGGALRTSRFWSLPAPAPGDRGPAPAADAVADEIGALLDASVRSQLMSDVPLGTFCSGGVDSGLVTSYAAPAATGAMHSFSVGFDDPAWDESSLARETADRCGTRHHVVRADAEAFLDALPSLIWHHDEPLSHPNAVPLYFLSRLAREHVRVVLTGEGADELFCGYPRYRIARLRGALAALPAPLLRWAGVGVGRLPDRRARLAGAALAVPLDEAILLNSAYVPPAVVATLTGRAVDAALDGRRDLLARAHVEGDVVGTLSRYEMSTYLGCALDRMDRMSMACGLEGRVPFLDVPLVERAASLPSATKLAGARHKLPVKRLAERRLTPAVAGGRKSGFGLPLDAWLRRPSYAPLRERLLNAGHPAATHVDAGQVRALLRAHEKGLADNGQALWLLANVYLWCETFSGASRADVALSRRPDAELVEL